MRLMRTITAITPTKDPGRASIKVDRRRVATLRDSLIADLGLTVGEVWDDDLASRVAEAQQYDKALRDAMNRLNRRALSTTQLADALRRTGFSETITQRALDRLSELNVLDDESLGRALIEEILARKPAGPRLLRQKLMQRGLDRNLADRLADEAGHERDEVAEAATLAAGRLETMRSLDEATRRRRLWSMLGRRGFDPETIEAALARLDESLRA